MPSQVQFFDRSGRALSRREAFEADGKTMRDGVSMRVPFRDSVHRGTVRDARAFWDQHRDELLITDARAIGGASGSRLGFRVSDSPINRQAIADAYAAYRRDIESAWRNPPPDAAFGSYPFSASAEGGPSSVNGAPGTLVREGDVLVCRPLAVDAAKPPRPDEDEGDDDGDDARRPIRLATDQLGLRKRFDSAP
jgi:hypothetical protein